MEQIQERSDIHSWCDEKTLPYNGYAVYVPLGNHVCQQ